MFNFSPCLTCKHSGAKFFLVFKNILVISPLLNLGTRVSHWWVKTGEKHFSTQGHRPVTMKIYYIQPTKWSLEAIKTMNLQGGFSKYFFSQKAYPTPVYYTAGFRRHGILYLLVQILLEGVDLENPMTLEINYCL